MSHKANPAIIGVFVVGAIVLTVVSILFFGSIHLFTRTERLVVFFEESVNGLDIGAPVKFNGVPIGEVTGIHLSFDKRQNETQIPVILTVEVGRLYDGLGFARDRDFNLFCEQAVSQGLRARLQYQSFVTGLLFVDLNYFPHDALLSPGMSNRTGYPSIPPMSSGLGEVWKSASATLEQISQIDFVGLSHELKGVLRHLDEGLSTLQFQAINDGLLSALHDFDTLVNLPELRGALHSLGVILDRIDNRMGPLADDVQLTMSEAREALRRVDSTFSALEGMLDPNASFRQEAEGAFQSFAEASHAVKELAESIERNPSSLLLGKP